jgi:mannose-1-phosphate guanylyltransferase
MARWAAVLAGGSGTRFWPLSSAERPKQLLPLASDRVLLQQAVDRLAGLIPPERLLVVTAAGLAAVTRAALPAVPPQNILGEPRPASTGPALAWATSEAQTRDPKAALLALHADWFVGDDAAFRATATRALDVAERHDRLVTVGVVPTRPDTSYGYIRPGDVLEGDARAVQAFVEKPDATRAATLIKDGALWNTGLFAWTAARFDAETRALAPEMAPHLELLAAGEVTRFFQAVTPIAVDVSHFERSKRVATVPGRFPWDDVGTWGALLRVRATDAAGNVLVGRTFQLDSAGCVVWADDGAIVLDGVRDLVVVRANGVTLVTTTARAEHLKTLLAAMPAALRQPERP